MQTKRNTGKQLFKENKTMEILGLKTLLFALVI